MQNIFFFLDPPSCVEDKVLDIEASMFQSVVLPCSVDGNPRDNTSWSWRLNDTRNRSTHLSSIERIEVS